MAYPSTSRFNREDLNCHCASIGSTPVASYLKVPYRGEITEFGAVAHGVITSADCSVAVAVNGTAVTGSPFLLTVALAAAGQVATLTPTAKVYVDKDDTVSFTPSGASGSAIPATFYAHLRQA